jgi:hypothetical protein
MSAFQELVDERSAEIPLPPVTKTVFRMRPLYAGRPDVRAFAS